MYLQRQNVQAITITLNGTQIISRDTINVLGVTFESKLQWSTQVANSIRKAKRELHALNLIKPYLTKEEMHQLITSN